MLPTESDDLRGVWGAVLALVFFAVAFAGWVLLRLHYDRLDDKLGLTAAVIALIPFLVWLIARGQLKQLKFGTEGFTAEFRDAITAPIKSSVKELPITTLQAEEKRDLAQLQEMINKKDQVLTFVLGKTYTTDMANKYMMKLTQQSFFRFVQLQQNGGALFGLVEARLLFDYLNTINGWEIFIKRIREIDSDYLKALPGFVSASLAVTNTASKSQVLEKMLDQHVDWLPVTGPDGKLMGIVERSAILARLVLFLNERLRQ